MRSRILPTRVLACAGLLVFSRQALSQPGSATSDTSTHVTIGSFVDTYYAFDFNRPRLLDRSYTTQAARHSEFNVNLAFVEAKLTGNRIRGRFALQAGTSVQSNYVGEPRIGSVSGPELSRHIQEAVVGYQLTDKAWIDAGIFYSHIGSESWASRDNLTYTRSLMAEYSPYYESGVKLSWQPTSSVAVTLAALNGWQNIAETNDDKAFGARVDWTVSPSATLSVYNFIGNEMSDTVARQQRFFQGASLTLAPNASITIIATADLGLQDTGADNATWYGMSLVARRQMTSTVALSARIERYDDKDQVIIVTGVPAGFRANGFSVGVDAAPQPRLTWRSELRMLQGTSAIFPDRSSSGYSRQNGLLVTSLGLTF